MKHWVDGELGRSGDLVESERSVGVEEVHEVGGVGSGFGEVGEWGGGRGGACGVVGVGVRGWGS